MLDDEFDVYQDLEDVNYEIKYKEKLKEVESLNSRLNELLERITNFEKENSNLKEANKILKKNCSSLMKTARNEIDRKDTRINELKAEMDNYFFRREKPKQNSCQTKSQYSQTNIPANNKKDSTIQTEEMSVFSQNDVQTDRHKIDNSIAVTIKNSTVHSTVKNNIPEAHDDIITDRLMEVATIKSEDCDDVKKVISLSHKEIKTEQNIESMDLSIINDISDKTHDDNLFENITKNVTTKKIEQVQQKEHGPIKNTEKDDCKEKVHTEKLPITTKNIEQVQQRKDDSIKNTEKEESNENVQKEIEINTRKSSYVIESLGNGEVSVVVKRKRRKLKL